MLLEVKNLQKTYGQFHLNCTMEIAEGCVTGLIGANGAGKSTLFKAILQLIYADDGEIRILGRDQNALTIKDREDIGVVMAESGFSSYLTIGKIIPILDNMYEKFDKEKFRETCQRFNLPVDKNLQSFSTGMRAKFNVLVAMSHDAKLLLLDEPTSGLDVLARRDLLDLLREYMEEGNRSILISSHISSDLEGLCDDLYLIHKGQIVLHEDADTLLDKYGLLKLTQEQYEMVDKKKLLYVQKENYGYHCLAKDRQFFMDNYPQFVIEKGNVDEVLTIIERGTMK